MRSVRASTDFQVNGGVEAMNNVLSSLTANHDFVTAWTAIAALLVSIISIGFTIVTIAMQRTHNRKSVVPIGHITVGDYDDRIFVRLRNDGVGPLIIEKLAVTNKNSLDKPRSALIDCMPDTPEGYPWTTFVEDVSGRAISPEKELTLILFEGNSSDRKFVRIRRSIREALSSLTIKVDYRNVYGELMPSAARNLDWFAR